MQDNGQSVNGAGQDNPNHGRQAPVWLLPLIYSCVVLTMLLCMYTGITDSYGRAVLTHSALVCTFGVSVFALMIGGVLAALRLVPRFSIVILLFLSSVFVVGTFLRALPHLLH